MISGIYQIFNTVSGKYYIGSSQNIKRRLGDHRIYLRNNKHNSRHLQASYNKYGKDAFEYSILEYCEINKLIEREQYWLDTIPKDKRYNQRPIVDSNRGRKLSEEQVAKLRARVGWSRGLKGKGIVKATPASFKKGEHRSVATEFKKGETTWNKGTKGLIKPNKGSFQPHQFEVVSPYNILYIGENLFKFSKEVGLSYDGLQHVVFFKKQLHHKGWRLPKITDNYEGIGIF